MKVSFKTNKIKISKEEAQVIKDRLKFRLNIYIQSLNKNLIEGLCNGDSITFTYQLDLKMNEVKKDMYLDDVMNDLLKDIKVI